MSRIQRHIEGKAMTDMQQWEGVMVPKYVVDAIRADEREECAVECEHEGANLGGDHFHFGVRAGAIACARRIRSRGK